MRVAPARRKHNLDGVPALLAAGYGAAIGTIIGGAKTLRLDEGRFVTMVKDALRAGHSVVVVQAADALERDRAREFIARTAAPDAASV